MSQDLGVVLYDREKNGVRVTAYQGPAKVVTVAQGEGCAPKEVKQHEYRVIGSVNGEEVRNEVIEGYRLTSPAARTMFKELCEQYGPVKAPKAPKVVLTRVKVEELLVKAKERYAKTGELITKYEAMLLEMPADGNAAVEGDTVEGDTVAAESTSKKKSKKAQDQEDGTLPLVDGEEAAAFTPSEA